MPVVINEFEVVDGPPSTASTSSSAAAQQAQPSLPDEEDLRRLLAELSEHRLRIWSH